MTSTKTVAVTVPHDQGSKMLAWPSLREGQALHDAAGVCWPVS